MNNLIITQIISLLVQCGAIAGLIISLFYLHNENRQERIVSDERWARLLESFTDFKNITVSRFADFDKALDKKQDRQ